MSGMTAEQMALIEARRTAGQMSTAVRALIADQARLTAELAAANETADEWAMVADGTKHDFRCRVVLGASEGWLCLRCQVERAEARASAAEVRVRLERTTRQASQLMPCGHDVALLVPIPNVGDPAAAMADDEWVCIPCEADEQRNQAEDRVRQLETVLLDVRRLALGENQHIVQRVDAVLAPQGVRHHEG